MNIRHTLQSQLGSAPHIQLNDTAVDPAAVRAIMINEVVPADPAQDFYGAGDGEYPSSTLALFRQAGLDVQTVSDLMQAGIYLTNAVKTPKTASAIEKERMAESLPWLEAEIALFPHVQVIMLMGDVARKMYNQIARKTARKNVISSGATYKLRANAYHHGSIRVMPSYIMTGGNLLIEKSKVHMITQDIAAMMEIIRQPNK